MELIHTELVYAIPGVLHYDFTKEHQFLCYTRCVTLQLYKRSSIDVLLDPIISSFEFKTSIDVIAKIYVVSHTLNHTHLSHTQYRRDFQFQIPKLNIFPKFKN